MKQFYTDASIVCLPSYREGMPKSLLEASAACCAIITTNVTGCRESIISGQTGDLVPVRDSKILAATLLGLIKDKKRQQQYGANGRELAIKLFDIELIKNQTLTIYNELLA
mgnify:FL=1